MPGCPNATVTFAPAKDDPDSATFSGGDGTTITIGTRQVALGDVTGDGPFEAMLSMTCAGNRGFSVIQRGVNGQLTQIGWVDPDNDYDWTFWISGGLLYADSTYASSQPIGYADAWRWDGSKLKVNSGPRQYWTIGLVDLTCGGKARLPRIATRFRRQAAAQLRAGPGNRRS